MGGSPIRSSAAAAWIAYALLTTTCASPKQTVGKACVQNSDCPSGVCLPLDTDHRVCTINCDDDNGCVKGWECLPVPGVPKNICTCLKLPEVCDGKDNDCDGIVDNGDEATCSIRGEQCVSGQCRCPAGRQVCQNACTDVATDARNCGACGNACPIGGSCVDGRCACPSGTQECHDECVALNSTANCGTCGKECLSGQGCNDGRCECGAGETLCDSHCVSLASDTSHCGSCGHSCLPGAICVTGQCQCPPNGIVCNDACVDGASKDNCRACGNTCADSEACLSTGCGCASGLTACTAHVCTDTTTDRHNCGTCGHACPSDAESCVSGQCHCDGLACSDGCFFSTGAPHCGDCSFSCQDFLGLSAAPPSAETQCVGTSACTLKMEVTDHGYGIVETPDALYWSDTTSLHELDLLNWNKSLIATSSYHPLVADGDALYGVNSDVLWKIPLADPAHPVNVAPFHFIGGNVEAAQGQIYFQTDTGIQRLSEAGGAPAPVVEPAPARLLAFTVDATHLCWSTYTEGVTTYPLMLSDLDGTHVVTLGNLPDLPLYLILSAHYVYAYRQPTRDIWRAALDHSGAIEHLLTANAPDTAVNVTADDTHLYLATEEGRVVRVPIGGGDRVTLEAGPIPNLAWPTIGAGNTLYWQAVSNNVRDYVVYRYWPRDLP